MQLWPFSIFIILFIKKGFTTFNPHTLIGEISSTNYMNLIITEIAKNSIYIVLRTVCGNLFLQCCALINCNCFSLSTN